MNRKNASKQICLIPLVFLLLTSCMTAKEKKLNAGFNPMSGEELQSLLSQKIDGSFYNNRANRTSKVAYHPNGTMSVSNSKLTDEGTWRIADNEFCSKWQKIRDGAERCTVWFNSGKGKYEVYRRDGSKGGVLTINM